MFTRFASHIRERNDREISIKNIHRAVNGLDQYQKLYSWAISINNTYITVVTLLYMSYCKGKEQGRIKSKRL